MPDWEIEPYEGGNETVTDTQDDFTDVEFRFVDDDPAPLETYDGGGYDIDDYSGGYEIDDYSGGYDYEAPVYEAPVQDAEFRFVDFDEPEPEPSGGLFNFYEPDDSSLPVVYEGDSTAYDLERYEAAALSSGADYQDADFSFADYDQQTPALEDNSPKTFWDWLNGVETVSDMAHETYTHTDEATGTRQKNAHRVDNRQSNRQDNQTNTNLQGRTQTARGGGGGGSRGGSRGGGGGGSSSSSRGGSMSPGTPWWYQFYPSPNESKDVQNLRYFYAYWQIINNGDPEWDEDGFHAWSKSLKGRARLYFETQGELVREGRAMNELKEGDFKRALAVKSNGGFINPFGGFIDTIFGRR